MEKYSPQFTAQKGYATAASAGTSSRQTQSNGWSLSVSFQMRVIKETKKPHEVCAGDC